jgi:deoxyribonuclease V
MEAAKEDSSDEDSQHEKAMDSASAETLVKWRQDQIALKEQLIKDDALSFDWPASKSRPLKFVGGLDISFVPHSETLACACLVVLSWPSLEVVYERCVLVTLTLPYIPGFLAFREVPHLQQLIDEIRKSRPDIIPQLLVLDGNGILHPRGFGVACHLGVLSDIPTIGVSKKLFVVDGLSKNKVIEDFRKCCSRAGESMNLVGDSGSVLGAALKTAADVINPVFVSVGHRITLKTALDLSSQMSIVRIPEPTRQADLRSRKYIRDHIHVCPSCHRNSIIGPPETLNSKLIKDMNARCPCKTSQSSNVSSINKKV